MSRSKCPFPDRFELQSVIHRWNPGQRGYSKELVPAIAIKNNGWYTVYSNDMPNLQLWQRRVYDTSLRWYDLQRKIDNGTFILYQQEEDIDIDISELL